MNSKAEALASAKSRIIALQSQMSSRILQMAKEVERLLETVSEQEAREFLRATCNMPSMELSTYVRFGSSLRGREELLQKHRVSFPVLRALVGTDEETRSEVLERLGERCRGTKRIRQAFENYLRLTSARRSLRSAQEPGECR